MSLDLNNIFRTLGATAVGLTLAIPLAVNTSADGTLRRFLQEPTVASEKLQDLTDNLTLPCIDYFISKADSKLEREAKTAIDDYFGGDVNHKAICDYVMK